MVRGKKNNRQLLITAFATVGILLSVLCSHSLARSLEEIRESNELRICVAGSSHELYKEMALSFADYIGIPAKVIRLDSWDRQFHNEKGVTVEEDMYTPALMASGECDLYPNDMVKNEWRLKKLDFVILFRNRMVVVVHHDNLSRFKTVDDLAGKTAAIQKGTSYNTWLDEKNASTFKDNPIKIQFLTTDKSMRAVDKKIVDFTIIGADGALNWTRKKVKNSVVAFPVGSANELGWAFRKEDKGLQAEVKHYFEIQARSQSRFDEIWAEKVGISLSEFTLFIATMLEE